VAAHGPLDRFPLERGGTGPHLGDGLRLSELALDHVLIAVEDLEVAGEALERRHGLASVEGGRHPGWGTANRIVPLRGAYLELVAVVDRDEAATVPFRRWIADAADGALVGWAVRTDDLDAIAARLELEVHAGARQMPDGGELRWRSAGIERSAVEPSLPFFIEWDDLGQHPSAAYGGGLAIEELVLSGDAERLAAWLGPHALPVDVRSGTPGVVGVVLGDGERQIAL
jgi:hypothetical protein